MGTTLGESAGAVARGGDVGATTLGEGAGVATLGGVAGSGVVVGGAGVGSLKIARRLSMARSWE